MSPAPKILLKHGKEAAVKRFHPWIFSGAIDRIDEAPADGDVVEVQSARGETVAMGHFMKGSIAVKIFHFGPVTVNEDFWKGKLEAAYQFRTRLGLTDDPGTNAFRLVCSEGDLLPSLIIDWYNGVAVIQTGSEGMQRLLPVFSRALQEIFGDKLTAVYHKASGGGFLYGSSDPVEILETGHRFMVDFATGQKTGFYLDQRGNRMFAQFYARGRSVLNTFCYSGAFSVYAAKGGATRVHSVDSSRQAIEWTEENMRLNGIDGTLHSSTVADVKQFLVDSKEGYDMIILDPPAFAKTHQVTNNALHAYIHINAEAMKKLNPGGILFTFSCSQAIPREMFRSAVQSAAIETGRRVRIMHSLSQGPDHPVSIFHPEGEYLKGLIVEVG